MIHEKEVSEHLLIDLLDSSKYDIGGNLFHDLEDEQ
jgi:hypothetical protein